MDKLTTDKLEEEFPEKEAIAIELPNNIPPARRVFDFMEMKQYRQHHKCNGMGEGMWEIVATKRIRRVNVLNAPEPTILKR